MKILQVNNVYRFGSTGKITYDIHAGLLARGYDSVVYYGRRDQTQDAHVHKICGEVYAKMNNALSRATGLMYGGCHLSTGRLISCIKREKPDVVHLQCINGYFVNIYRLISFLKREKIPTVLTLHAEFMHTANCGYALDCDQWKTGCGHCPRLRQETQSLFFDRTAESFKRMKKAFDGFEQLLVVSVSPWLMERAKQSPILADKKHCVVFNGLDTDVFTWRDGADLRKELGISSDQKVVFHATPMLSMDPAHIKGGCHVVNLAREMADENVVFVVAGNYDASVQYPANMRLLGNVSQQQKLAQLYAMADVTLLTSKKETFSMVCAESLCCGTPVVGYEAGAPEKISLPAYSQFVSQGDGIALKDCVQKWLQADVTLQKAKISDEAKKIYAADAMVDAYCRCYDEV